MPTLALAVIARDEERGLPLTIASVRALVDEVVVAVDRRTTDRTREVAGDACVLDVGFTDFAQMRNAGASARHMLVGAAASEWGVPASEITVSKGVVRHAKSGKSAGPGP